jgi:hypothetical protein
MNWKPTHGKKLDLPDNQIVNLLYDDGSVSYSRLKDVIFSWTEIVFYRDSFVIDEHKPFTPIINNQRPEGLHDDDEIEFIYASGKVLKNIVNRCCWGGDSPSMKLFYRLTKKYEEQKPKRVGELMTFEEFFYKAPLSFNMGDFRNKYINYIKEQIKNDR